MDRGPEFERYERQYEGPGGFRGDYEAYEDRGLFPPPPPARQPPPPPKGGEPQQESEDEEDLERQAFEVELQRVAADLEKVGRPPCSRGRSASPGALIII